MEAFPKPANWAPPAQDPAAAPAQWPRVRRVLMRAMLVPPPEADALVSIGGVALEDFPATRLVVRGHAVFVYRTGIVLTTDTPDAMSGMRTVDELVSMLASKGLRVSLVSIREATVIISGAIGRRVDTRAVSEAYDGELDEDGRFQFERADYEYDEEEFPKCTVGVMPNGELDVAHEYDLKQAYRAFIKAHDVLDTFFVPLGDEERPACTERDAHREPRREAGVSPEELAVVVQHLADRLKASSAPENASE